MKRPEDREELLDDVVAAYLDALDRGAAPNREELVARHPELRDGLEAFFRDQDRFRGGVERVRASSRSLSPIRAGDLLGDYELLDEIARGGMGVVYRARHRSLRRNVALKTVLAGSLANEEALARFHREARAVAQLDHPGIVPVYDVGEHDGISYFTMKLLDGGSLAEVPDRYRDPRAAARLVESVARAVQCAHVRGIVHRDLKPANILIDGDGAPYVTDFGLARFLESEHGLTQSGALLGTPTYMAPEQAAGGKAAVTAAVDVYALGVILYELVAGRPPFRGDSSIETLRAIQRDEPPRIRATSPGVPVDLDTICMKCLEKSPSRRYANAGELADDLERFLTGRPVAARPVSSAERAWRWCQRNPAVTAIAMLLAALATVSSVAALVWREAEERATLGLLDAYYNQARFARSSGQSGRRFESLRVLAAAARIEPSLRLRNEAAACMALADIEPVGPIVDIGPESVVDTAAIDAAFGVAAWTDRRGALTVRRLRDGGVVLRREGSGRRCKDIRFSPDGRFLLAYREPTYSGKVEVWRLDAPQQPVFSKEPLAARKAYDVDAESRRLSIALADGSIRLVALADGSEIGTLRPAGLTRPLSLRFRPDGEAIAVAGTLGRVQAVVVIATTGEVERTLVVPKRARHVAWSRDGDFVAVASGETILVAQAATGLVVSSLDGHEVEVNGLAFHPSGHLLASTSWDRTVRVWNFRTSTQLVRGRGNYELTFNSAGDALAVTTELVDFVLWRFAEGNECRTLVSPLERSFSFEHALSPDGRVLAVASRSGVRIWDVRSGTLCGVGDAGTAVNSVRFTRDGRTLVTWSERGIEVWPVVTREPVAERSRLVIGPPRQLELAEEFPFLIDFGKADLSSDDRTLVVASFTLGAGVVLDLAGERAPFRVKVRGLHAVAASPGGKFIAGSPRHGSDEVIIWDASNGRRLQTLACGESSVAFSGDDKWLATGSRDLLRLWSTATWELAWEIPNPGLALAFGPDSRTLAVAQNDDRVIRLVDVATGGELISLRAPAQGIVHWISFDRTGHFLVATCRDGPALVWDLGAVRRQLEAIGLDWDAGALPPPPLHDGTHLDVEWVR